MEAVGDTASLLVLHWVAPWAAASLSSAPMLQHLAATWPHVLVCSLNVEASPENSALAWEKVLAKAVARRDSTRPCLRSGGKWPCFTLHAAPSLDPWMLQLTGPQAPAQLLEEVAQLVAEQFPPPSPSPSSVPTPLSAPSKAPEPACRPDKALGAAGPVVGKLPASARRLAGGPAEGPGQQAEAVAGGGAEPGPKSEAAAGHGVRSIKKGALDLKQALGAGPPGGLLLVAWVRLEGGGEQQAEGKGRHTTRPVVLGTAQHGTA
ncbi:hypothetical protein V8C86DRAFT_744417 [Haematococcus lacustris]